MRPEEACTLRRVAPLSGLALVVPDQTGHDDVEDVWDTDET
ncbi:hypothetical protein F8B43_2594 [Methylorubrum populi]|uniref:Uncharacterized protein n=1 Tax=Methylorubrum populi TaxID=223967 RepID=A0A833J763_9HYPH|nr:hypothetical protein F8B43_2594 [Methylorubrum populi]